MENLLSAIGAMVVYFACCFVIFSSIISICNWNGIEKLKARIKILETKE